METFKRLRNLRKSVNLRKLVQETKIDGDDFIYPMFIKEVGDTTVIPSMPGIYQYSLADFTEELNQIVSLGIKAVLLFGIPEKKDSLGTGAYAADGIVQQACRLAKNRYPELVVICDTCLCEYTDHGHCGIVERGEILNDPSLELLVKTAVSQAESGADIVAPSNAMDGFTAAIRSGLDRAGYSHIPVMSYAVKYCSSFYGPFREAAGSAPQFGDRKTYQMDPANSKEAIRELEADISEGADLLIVKPALSYLDIVYQAAETSQLPIIAYNVSGEYAMVKAAAAQGWIDEKQVVHEMLLSMKRAGADLIITYFAKEYLLGRKNEGEHGQK